MFAVRKALVWKLRSEVWFLINSRLVVVLTVFPSTFAIYKGVTVRNREPQNLMMREHTCPLRVKPNKIHTQWK